MSFDLTLTALLVFPTMVNESCERDSDKFGGMAKIWTRIILQLVVIIGLYFKLKSFVEMPIRIS